jgi:SAM-dependent methyltransferase
MTPTAPPPRLFDSQRRRHRLARARLRFADADFLHRRATANAVDTLSATLRDFDRAVDLSPHPGLFEAMLEDTPARARIGRVETPLPMEAAVSPGAQALPVADGSVDLMVSMLGLHWADDLPGALAQIRRALRPDGLFLGTLLGGSTLTELRQVMTEAEMQVRGGAQARVSPFADGFDGAALMQRAGFALPVCEVDRVTVRYPDLFALVADLRAMGETNGLAGPVRPLTRPIMARAAALYAERFGEADGRIPARFEIISLGGWAPHDSQQKPAQRGSATVRLAHALGARELTGDEREP